jgi:hypothetical protein
VVTAFLVYQLVGRGQLAGRAVGQT